MRVVSLLPSATEILLDICGPGVLRASGPVQLVGRSHECDGPVATVNQADLDAVPVLTTARTTFTTAADVDRQVRAALSPENSNDAPASLYSLDADTLAALKPDVIITQDLCRVCSIDLATVERVARTLSPSPRVVSLNPGTFEDVLDDVLRVGEAVGEGQRALERVVELRGRVYWAQEHMNPFADGPSVGFLEWTDPLFAGGHWTPQLIERAGGVHPLNPTKPVAKAGAGVGPIGQTQRSAGPSARIEPEALVRSQPEYLFVCPCGLTLQQAQAEVRQLAGKPWWRRLPAVQAGRVWAIDGNQMFNRPGPRLVDAFEWLVSVLNDRPELAPENFPATKLGEPAGGPT